MKIETETIKTIVLSVEDVNKIRQTIQAYDELDEDDKREDIGIRYVPFVDDKDKAFNIKLVFEEGAEDGE